MMNKHTFASPPVLLMIITVAVAGCFGGPEPDGRETAEHFVPAHWPADLLDASTKLAQRASELSSPSNEATARTPTDGLVTDRTPMVERELRDIVGWVPEIAADTPLTEAQWMVVYEASESLSKRLRKIRRPLDDETLGAIDDYRRLLVETSKKLTEDSQ